MTYWYTVVAIMPNRMSQSDQLDKFISILRVVG